MNLITKEILVKARELISDEDRWIKYEFALDKDANVTSPYGNEAYMWCLAGSINAASARIGVSVYEAIKARKMLLKMPDLNGFPTFNQWNDRNDRTHDEVIDLLDRAISSTTSNPQQQEARQ